MNNVIHLFWNPEERRLRCLFRLILQIVFLLILSLASGLIANLLITLLPHLPINYILSQAIFSLGIVASVWLGGKFLDRRHFVDFGLHFDKNWWLDFLFGLALGAILMAFIFIFERSMGWIEITIPQLSADIISAIIDSFFLFVFVGIYEELFSRGYQLLNLAEGFSGLFGDKRIALFIGWVLSSSVFGVLHAANPNSSLTSSIYIIFAGLFLGLGLILSGELAIGIGIHITWNFFQGNIFGFPVSGVASGASVFQIQQKGPEFITGGAFGPEAGLIGVAAILTGCILILLWTRIRKGKIGLHPMFSSTAKGLESDVEEIAS